MTMPPASPKKSRSGPLVALISVAVFVLVGVGVTGIMEQRHLQTNGQVSSGLIVGEWLAVDKASRIVFRADKTLDIRPDGAAAQPGSYQLRSGGLVSVAMNDGRRFTATFREFTPNQFDLVNSETQGVQVFAKAPSPQ
jgi:hypothetical protein